MNRLTRKLYTYFCETRSLFAKIFMTAPNVLNTDDTLDLIINHHYSISRNGDGEIDIMLGESIPFQKYDVRLSQLLKEAIVYQGDKYISAIPNIFKSVNRFNPKAQFYFQRYLKLKRWNYYRLARAERYGDTQISRFYIDYVDKSNSTKQVEKLKQIWSGQKVLLIEGAESRLGVNNDLFDGCALLHRILAPSENAFSVYDQIKQSVLAVANNYDLILLALGPTATALAYEFAKQGLWAVDIGHIDIEYEWFLMKADHKVPVIGKYTNESTEGKLIGSLPQQSLDIYHKQILKIIQ